MKFIPKNGWVLAEQVNEETGAVVSTEQANRKQVYKVLEISDSRTTEYGAVKEAPAKVGDTILVELSAEANTPANLLKQNQAVFLFDRIIAVLEDN